MTNKTLPSGSALPVFFGGVLGWWLADKFGWNPFGWAQPFPHDSTSNMILFCTGYLIWALEEIRRALYQYKQAL
jgi:hypothetical protein